MAGWTKAQYDVAYRTQIERRMPGGGPPPAEGRPPVFIHYHKWSMQPILAQMWANIQPALNILSTDHLCIVGAGFGWGVDAAQSEVGPANIVGIDISDYIAAEMGNTEEAELRAHVTTATLDPDSGRGLEVMNFVSDGQPRSNIVVLQNSAASANERQEIRTALGGNWPSVVVYEDIVDDTITDQEILNARNAGNGFGGSQRLIWIYNGTDARSQADLQTISLGAEVISRDGQSHLT